MADLYQLTNQDEEELGYVAGMQMATMTTTGTETDHLTCGSNISVVMDHKGEQYLAAFAGDAAIVVACGFVPAHYTQFIFVQVTWDVPWQRHTGNTPNMNNSKVY